jgi:hypothetical protein
MRWGAQAPLRTPAGLQNVWRRRIRKPLRSGRLLGAVFGMTTIPTLHLCAGELHPLFARSNSVTFQPLWRSQAVRWLWIFGQTLVYQVSSFVADFGSGS